MLRTVVAQAASTKAVGAADAEVIRLKINSMEAGNYAVVQVAEPQIRHKTAAWSPTPLEDWTNQACNR